jgi:hypothetical protein
MEKWRIKIKGIEK